MNQKQGAHFDRMTEAPVGKLILSLAVPTVISMLVNNIYNMADTFFVSRLGTSASGAVGIVATLTLILLTCGLMFGHGAGSLIARALGSGEDQRADTLASTAFFSALFVGAAVAFLGLLFLSPLMRLLGSTETVLPYAKAYGFYILLAAPFTVASFVLNNIMRYEGKARLAMVGLTTGAILNIILDPLFIFGLKMGIHGAGFSTASSQVISFFILLYFYVSGKTHCRIAFRSFKPREIPDILKNGLPTLSRQGMNMVSSILLNRSAAVFGDTALAAIAIVNQISNFILSIMIGIGQGYQPFSGFNYGAGKMDRLKKGYYFTFFLGECVLFTLSVLFFFGANPIVSAFRDDLEVVKTGAFMLRLSCISLLCQPYIVCSNMMFQSIGETTRATFLATTRNGIYLIPLLLVFPRLFGLTGILLCQPVADILSVLTAVPIVTIFFKKQKQ